MDQNYSKCSKTRPFSLECSSIIYTINPNDINLINYVEIFSW